MLGWGEELVLPPTSDLEHDLSTLPVPGGGPGFQKERKRKKNPVSGRQFSKLEIL